MSTPPGDLDRLAAEHLEAARARWPGIRVDEAGFLEHLRTVGAAAGEEGPAEPLRLADLFLAYACGQGDAEALRAFDASILAVVAGTVARIDPSPAFADEVRQRLRANLLVASDDRPPKILAYSGKGPLDHWVRAAALRTALSLRRGRHHQELAVDDLAPDAAAGDDDPELAYLKERYARELNEAFATALERLDAKDRNLLRLHYVERLSFIQLAAHYQAHRVTVSRWVDEARQRLLDETRRLLSERLQLGREEFESLVRLVRSQLALRTSLLLSRDGR